MEIVINIEESLYNTIMRSPNSPTLGWYAIAHGTVLPKGHGRLIDADSLKTSRTMALVAEKDAPQNEIAFAPLVCVLKENIDDAPTIVEADKENDNG